jgi:hypothetical protein
MDRSTESHVKSALLSPGGLAGEWDKVQPRPLPAYKQNYRVWPDGTIETSIRRGRPRKDGSRSSGTWKPLTRQWHNSNKRLQVTITVMTKQKDPDGNFVTAYKSKTVPVAREVLLAFVGHPPDDKHIYIGYVDNNPRNCHIANLFWSANKTNSIERRLIGDAKSRRSQVDAIYTSFASGEPVESIAKKHGVPLRVVVTVVRKAHREAERAAEERLRKTL